MNSIRLGDKTISYRIVRKPNKHTYLAIKGNVVEVRANRRVSDTQIEALIQTKADWILKRLDESVSEPSTFEFALVWGNRMEVAFENEQAMRIDGARLILPSDVEASSALVAFYRYQTQQYLAMHLPIFAEKMQLFPTKVSVRHTTSRWGSCSSRNALSFSLLSAQLPTSVVDYLIVHELAHIRHKHHQASFWALVEQHCPNMKVERKRLRDYEKQINWLKYSQST